MKNKPNSEESEVDKHRTKKKADDGGNVSKESSSRKWTKKEMEEAAPLPLPEIEDDSDDN